MITWYTYLYNDGSIGSWCCSRIWISSLTYRWRCESSKLKVVAILRCRRKVDA